MMTTTDLLSLEYPHPRIFRMLQVDRSWSFSLSITIPMQVQELPTNTEEATSRPITFENPLLPHLLHLHFLPAMWFHFSLKVRLAGFDHISCSATAIPSLFRVLPAVFALDGLLHVE